MNLKGEKDIKEYAHFAFGYLAIVKNWKVFNK